MEAYRFAQRTSDLGSLHLGPPPGDLANWEPAVSPPEPADITVEWSVTLAEPLLSPARRQQVETALARLADTPRAFGRVRVRRLNLTKRASKVVTHTEA